MMVACIQECSPNGNLQHRIQPRHHNVRNFQLVGHQLVGMFAMGIKNILFQHQTVHNGKHTIHAVHRQKNDPAQVARLQDKRTQHVQHDKRHTHRTHISNTSINCLGLSGVFMGQNRLPIPPAIIIT